jgi:hypothetical protein
VRLDAAKLDAACAKADALSRRFAARSDIDPVSMALATHLMTYGPAQAQHSTAPAHQGQRPPSRWPGPTRVRPNENVSGRYPRKEWKTPRVDARGDGLSVIAALVAFLGTASISTLVTWGMDKIQEAKDMVRIASTGKLEPRDVAKIRKAMDKLKAAEKAAREARQPKQIGYMPQRRLEPRFDRADADNSGYEKAKEIRKQLDEEVSRLGKVLNAFPKGAMGLTPDEVKKSPEWKAAKTAFDSKFKQLQNFNSNFVKVFAKEARAEREQRNSDRSRGDVGSIGHVHPLTGTIFGTMKPAIDLTTTGGGIGAAGSIVMALAVIVAAASLGYLIKKGADWLSQKIDMLRIARSGGKISAKDRVEIMAAIEKLKLAKYRAEALRRGDALPPRSAHTMSEAISMSSPSGRVSKRSKDAALKRLSTELFGEGGLQRSTQKQPSKRESLLRQAKDLRDLAARGMSVKKFIRQAEMLEAQAAKEPESRGDFWKKPETGTAVAKPQQSSPAEIGGFLKKAQETKPATGAPAPATAASSTAAAPAAAAAHPSSQPAAAAAPSTALTRVPVSTTKRQWKEAKPQKGNLKPWYGFGKTADRKKLTRTLNKQHEERTAASLAQGQGELKEALAKQPKTRTEYREQKREWKAARKQQKGHEKAWERYETNIPPPGSPAAHAAEAKQAAAAKQKEQARIGWGEHVEREQKKNADARAAKAAKVEAKRVKKHGKQFERYERDDPAPGSEAWRRHNMSFGTLPDQPKPAAG